MFVGWARPCAARYKEGNLPPASRKIGRTSKSAIFCLEAFQIWKTPLESSNAAFRGLIDAGFTPVSAAEFQACNFYQATMTELMADSWRSL